MARSLLITGVFLLLISPAAVQADFTWNFEDYVRGALENGFAALTGSNEDNNHDLSSTHPVLDAIVCTQEVVCGSDGETYPNPCLAKEAGVEVVPCPRETRSGALLGIPDALIGIGQDFLNVFTAPLTGAKKGNNKGGGSGFNPVDPLNLFDDPLTGLFENLRGRRLRVHRP